VREVHHRYVDPLAQVWLDAAARIGLRVVRSADAYAATDGRGTLVIGDDASLDPDDSLAQMIFHELCHSLVQGEGSFARPDWGMDNIGDGDVWREHACLRLQAYLSARHGMRGLFAPTTDFRAFWDALPADPLADRLDPSVTAAIRGVHRAARAPWSPALDDALAATSRIAAAVSAARGSPAPAPRTDASSSGPRTATPPSGPRTDAPPSGPRTDASPSELRTDAPPSGSRTDRAVSVESTDRGALPVLWDAIVAPRGVHPIGLAAAAEPGDGGCASCAWRYIGGPGKKAERCRQADGKRIDLAWPACERYEAATSMDCQTCGACCREAYGSVEVAPRDPIRKTRPDFVVNRGTYLEVRREGERCAALEGGAAVPSGANASAAGVNGANASEASGGGLTTTRYRCTIYEDRPRTCRDFTLGSDHCMTARQRVGLTL
jgi:Fe-S-cluster containining protein